MNYLGKYILIGLNKIDENKYLFELEIKTGY